MYFNFLSQAYIATINYSLLIRTKCLALFIHTKIVIFKSKIIAVSYYIRCALGVKFIKKFFFFRRIIIVIYDIGQQKIFEFIELFVLI